MIAHAPSDRIIAPPDPGEKGRSVAFGQAAGELVEHLQGDRGLAFEERQHVGAADGEGGDRFRHHHTRCPGSVGEDGELPEERPRSSDAAAAVGEVHSNRALLDDEDAGPRLAGLDQHLSLRRRELRGQGGDSLQGLVAQSGEEMNPAELVDGWAAHQPSVVAGGSDRPVGAWQYHAVEQRLSLVTLGVSDIARSRRFYEALGWSTDSEAGDDVVFFRAGGMVLGLWDRGRLADDSGVVDGGGWGGVTLAHNVRFPSEVDAVIDEVRAAGGTIVREPAATFWGGYSGAFVDPDGHPWEVAHNPFWHIAEDGSIDPFARDA